jgi:hypothetical protein
MQKGTLLAFMLIKQIAIQLMAAEIQVLPH